MVRTSGARVRAWAAKICLLCWMSAVVNSLPVGVRSGPAGDADEVEHGRGVHQGQQVVDLEVQLGGDVGQVDPSPGGVDDLHEAGKATDRRGREGSGGRGGFGGFSDVVAGSRPVRRS